MINGTTCMNKVANIAGFCISYFAKTYGTNLVNIQNVLQLCKKAVNEGIELPTQTLLFVFLQT